jgi:hypothetical protein
MNEAISAIYTVYVVSLALQSLTTLSDRLGGLVASIKNTWQAIHPDTNGPPNDLSRSVVREIVKNIPPSDTQEAIKRRQLWYQFAAECLIGFNNGIDNAMLQMLAAAANIFFTPGIGPVVQNIMDFLQAARAQDKMDALITAILDSKRVEWAALRRCLIDKLNQ